MPFNTAIAPGLSSVTLPLPPAKSSSSQALAPKADFSSHAAEPTQPESVVPRAPEAGTIKVGTTSTAAQEERLPPIAAGLACVRLPMPMAIASHCLNSHAAESAQPGSVVPRTPEAETVIEVETRSAAAQEGRLSPIAAGLACVRLPMPNATASHGVSASGYGAAACNTASAPAAADADVSKPAESVDETTSDGGSSMAPHAPATDAALRSASALDGPDTEVEEPAAAAAEENVLPAAAEAAEEAESAGPAGVEAPAGGSPAPDSGAADDTAAAAKSDAKDEAAAEEAAPAAPAVEVEVGVGDEVKCQFGRGRVSNIRQDGIYVVRALDWSLANDSRPTYYMQKSFLKRVRPKNYHEMSTSEKLERAAYVKERGAAAFKEQRFDVAAGLYMDALRALEVRDELSNLERAKTIEMMVPCHNNVASCQLRLKNYKEALVAAKNAYQICEALEKNASGAVMTTLRRRGLSDHRIFVQWKSKALFLAGKANLKWAEYADAKLQFEAAVAAADGKPGMAKEVKEMRALLEVASKHLRAKEKQEKRMWNKAFTASAASGANGDSEAAAGAAATNGGAAGAEMTNGFNGKPHNGHAVAKENGQSGAFGALPGLGPLKAVPRVVPRALPEEVEEKEAARKGKQNKVKAGVVVASAAAVVIAGAIAFFASRRRR